MDSDNSETHPALRLLAWQAVAMLLALGVFFAFLLGATATDGGTITLDMTQYGERWVEYWLMVGLTATTPWALFYFDRRY
jgi:hypothetical protein